jgi:hypothetical protein
VNAGYKKLESWDGFNLALSLKASFSLPLFNNPNHNTFVKIYGHGSGTVLKMDGGATYYHGCSLREALVLSGAWFNLLENAKKLSRRKAFFINRFWEVFSGLSIATNPWDLRAMLYSIFLSRNTRYHVNTVKWLRDMVIKAGDENRLAYLDPKAFGASYQLVQLAEIKPLLDEVLSETSSMLKSVGFENAFSKAKARLLSIRYVGSKIVHAFGLFCLGLTRLAPADRHLVLIAKSIGVIDDDAEIPRKKLCLKYDCFRGQSKCPIIEKCVVASLMKNFGPMAGWLQTATYLYGALYLSRGLDPANLLRK